MPALTLLDRVRRHSLVRNSTMVMGTTATTSLLGYAFWLVAARLYPARVVGLGVAITSTMALVSLLAYLGVGAALIEALPRQSGLGDWSAVFDAGMATSAVVALLAAGVPMIVLPLLSDELTEITHSPALVVLFVLGAVVMACGSTLDYAFIAERRAGNMLTRNALASGGKLAVLPVLALLGTGTQVPIVASWTLGGAVSLAVGLTVLLPRVRSHRLGSGRGVVRRARRLAGRVLGHQVVSLGGLVPTYVLPVLVTARLSAAADAYFYVAWALGGAFFMISPAVAAALFAEGSHSRDQLARTVRTAAVVIGAVLVPCAVVVLLVGGRLLSVFGAGYAHHGTVLLRLLVVSAVPDAVTNLYVSVARLQGRLRRAAGLNLGMAAGALGLSWLLLPRLGIASVGWAWLLAQGAGAVFVLGEMIATRAGRFLRERFVPRAEPARPSRPAVAFGRGAAPEQGPLRILHLTDLYPPAIGGRELQVELLASQQAARGHHVAVATAALPGAPRLEIDGGVRVHRLEGWARVASRLLERRDRPFHPPFPDPGMVRALERVVATERPDVVHAHSWMVSSFLPLRRRSQARLVVWLHDYSAVCPRTTYVHRGHDCDGPGLAKCVGCGAEQYGWARSAALSLGMARMRGLSGAVDRFVANSVPVADAVCAALDLSPGAIEVVAPGIPATALAGDPPRPHFVPPGDYLMFVGALGPHKGLDVLLEAYAALPNPPPLVLIGTRRNDTPDRVPPGVVLVEEVPHSEVLAAWRHCMFGLLPSVVREGFGVAALEAMGAGKAVVASRVGGLAELVVDGITGVLVPPGDVGALGAAMGRLLSDAGLRQRMGEAGRQRAASFESAGLVERMDEVYRQVLTGRRHAVGVPVAVQRRRSSRPEGRAALVGGGPR